MGEIGIGGLAPAAWLLLSGVALDAIFGDPQVSYHPIRFLGRSLASFERLLRRAGWDGYGGGCGLFLILTLLWVLVPAVIVAVVYEFSPLAASVIHVVLIYILLALRDLFDHVRAVGRAAVDNDVNAARIAIARLVGRDTSRLDAMACRRAAIESLAESFVDGFVASVFWYLVLGLPGMLLFKVISTMDSMVGYKTARYLRFGWCGARLDDAMNYVPARIAWIILGVSALFVPKLSATNGWRIGIQQHSILPGPNPGWSEATMAGVLQRRLIGPIWKDGMLVTNVWIGDEADLEAGSQEDLMRAITVTVVAAFLVVLLSVLFLRG